MITFAQLLLKARGWKPYRGKGKRTGAPGHYHYDYEQLGLFDRPAPRPKAKPKAKPRPVQPAQQLGLFEPSAPAPAPSVAAQRWRSGEDGVRGEGLKILSMFSGVGGLDLGFHRALPKAQTVGFAEIDEHASKILARHFPEIPNHGDVVALADRAERGELEDPPNMLIGGFPCQDLSQANQHAEGLEGKRSGLYKQMIRVAEATQPDWIVFENVPQLRRRGLDLLLADCVRLGYGVTWDHIPASAVGAPHQRDRIFVVAHPPDTGFAFPEGEDEPHSAWYSPPHDEPRKHSGTYEEAVNELSAAGNAVVPQVAERLAEGIRTSTRTAAPPAGKLLAKLEGGQWIRPNGKRLEDMPRAGRVWRGALYEEHQRARKPRPGAWTEEDLREGQTVWIRDDAPGTYAGERPVDQRELLAHLQNHGSATPPDHLKGAAAALQADGLLEPGEGPAELRLSGLGAAAAENMVHGTWAGEGGANELIFGNVLMVNGDQADIELPNGDIEPFALGEGGQVYRIPTPTKTDYKGGYPEAGHSGQSDARFYERKRGAALRHWVDGKVNPRIAEWAMGFPKDWIKS